MPPPPPHSLAKGVVALALTPLTARSCGIDMADMTRGLVRRDLMLPLGEPGLLCCQLERAM